MNHEATLPAPSPEKAVRDRNILILLWGLIVAKCFMVEYLVRVYEVPINSVLYIWTPTLIFAAVASVVYVTLIHEESPDRLPARVYITLWSSAGLAFALTVTAGFLGFLDLYLVSTGLALILGASYGFLSTVSEERLLYGIAAGGWLIIGGVQFVLGDVRNLLLFSIAVLFFTVAPVATLMIRRRKR